MDKRQVYTALIGIFGILFSFTALWTDLDARMQSILGILGLLTFLWAAVSLYLEWHRLEEAERLASGKLDGIGNRITRVELLNEENAVISTWDLYQKASALIGRDYKENQVDIDLGRSEYGALVDIHHAVLNYAGGVWYVEDLGSQNGVSVQKKADSRKYKLSGGQPCKLERGDILLIGMCRLRLS